MNSSNEHDRQASWLLLIHQLPPQPDYLRVRVRRQLQRLGALLLKNSVYVLPSTSETLEDFQWLRRVIQAEGGEATLVAAEFIEGVTGAEVEQRFREASDAEFMAVIESIEQLGGDPDRRELARVRRKWADARSRDHFGSAQGMEAERMLKEREQGRGGGQRSVTGTRPAGAVWVTRRGVQVDRMASAWLIRRFIDASARFRFVAERGYEPAEGELRFDMFEGEYTHEGGRCTFEVLLDRFELMDPALSGMGQIVHDIDFKEDTYGREETEGIRAVLRGVTLAWTRDEERIEATRPLFDGLYEDLRRDTV